MDIEIHVVLYPRHHVLGSILAVERVSVASCVSMGSSFLPDMLIVLEPSQSSEPDILFLNRALQAAMMSKGL